MERIIHIFIRLFLLHYFLVTQSNGKRYDGEEQLENGSNNENNGEIIQTTQRTFSPLLSRPRPWKTLNGEAPLMIAHRGEKILAPEHTLYAYKLASILGADYVEPDLYLTKDDELICHHDRYLSETETDVGSHPEFQHLKKPIRDGTSKWAVRDFTLEQIKKLRVNQARIGFRPQDLNGFFQIPSFQEYVDVIHETSFKLNRTIGIIPELKEPAYHNANGANLMEYLLLAILKKNGYDSNRNDGEEENCTAKISHAASGGKISYKKIQCPVVIIQSFELPALEYLKRESTFDLMMLVMNNPKMVTRTGIEKISKTATYFAVYKSLLLFSASTVFTFLKISYNPSEIEELGGFVPHREYVSLTHKLGMKLVVYTIFDSREENRLGCSNPSPIGECPPVSKMEELKLFFDTGVDGMFVENVAESVGLRNEYLWKETDSTNEVQSRSAGSEGSESNAKRKSSPKSQIKVHLLTHV